MSWAATHAASRPGLCDYDTAEVPVKHRPRQGDPELSPGATCLGHADRVIREGHVMRGQGAGQATQTPALHLLPLINAVPGLSTLMGGTPPDCSLLSSTQAARAQLCLQRNCCRGSLVSAGRHVEGLWWVGASRGPAPPGRRWTPPCAFPPGPQRQASVGCPI